MRWWKKFKAKKAIQKKDCPNVVQSYVQSFQREVSGMTKGRDESVRFIIFDTETTGADFQSDHLLSIGAVVVQGNSILLSDNFYELVDVSRDGKNTEDITIHGILPNELKQGRDLDSILLDFLEYVGNSILVAHHSDFDVDFLNYELEKRYGITLLNRVIDTAHLARKIFSTMNANAYEIPGGELRLDNLCQVYKVAYDQGRHHAEGDAYITAELFLKLTNKLIRMGRLRLRDWLG